MCQHNNASVIEENVSQEKWEGDLYVQEFFSWYYCPDCDDDFACKAR